MSYKHALLAASYPILEIIHSVRCYAKSNVCGRLRVLVFHDIAPNEIENFSKQLCWLAKKWKFINANTFNSMLSGEKDIIGDNILLTFDDGFVSNRIVAEKILNKMGIQAIFFVVSGFVELSSTEESHNFIAKGIRTDVEPKFMPQSWRNMNWADLLYLIESGHTIGAHTATHARLSEINTRKELETEIIDSANILEKKLGITIEHFAFTFGDFNSMSSEALSVAKQRFKFIHSSIRGKNIQSLSPFYIYRDTIAPYDNKFLIGAFLAGGADLLYKKVSKLFKKFE